MKIIRLQSDSKSDSKSDSNYCGGFKPPKKGDHMDTQMYPECEGYPTDRDIVKNTTEKKKKKKKKKSDASFNLQRHLYAKRTTPEYDKSPTEEGFMDDCARKPLPSGGG